MKRRNTRQIYMTIIVLVLFVLNLPATALAWGKDGHVIVAHLASRMLTPKAAARVDALLKGDETLENIALWADSIRGSRNNPGPRIETPHWHFIDIPLNSNYDARRDCAETPNGSCAISALVIFQEVLSEARRGYYNDEFNRYEALKFIVHFAGDIHQPLHCVDDNDAGGNGKNVFWLSKNERRNLHQVWDNEILAADMKARNLPDDIDYADFIFENLTPQQINLAAPKPSVKPTMIDRATIENWAKESHDLAKLAYADLGPRDANGFYFLKDAYSTKYKPEVNKRLAAAGIRLARILNENLR